MPTLSIKLGGLEVAYDGDQKFIEAGMLTMLKELVSIKPPPGGAPTAAEDAAKNQESGEIGHTTSQIAHSMGASTGTDLVLAAALHLTLVKKNETIKRSEIMSEIKSAGGFYKETFAKNLTNSLDTLVKTKRLNPVSTGVFSVPAGVRKEFSGKLKSE